MIADSYVKVYEKMKRFSLRHGVDLSDYLGLCEAEDEFTLGVKDPVQYVHLSVRKERLDNCTEINVFGVDVCVPAGTELTTLLDVSVDLRKMVRFAQALNAEGVIVHRKSISAPE